VLCAPQCVFVVRRVLSILSRTVSSAESVTQLIPVLVTWLTGPVPGVFLADGNSDQGYFENGGEQENDDRLVDQVNNQRMSPQECKRLDNNPGD
jgi:hypothetical protein